MRIVSLVCLLFALAGCAQERAINFVYYPDRPEGDVFPRPSQFAAEAQKECAKYGLIAVHDWDSWTTFQRVRSSWRCVQPAHTAY